MSELGAFKNELTDHTVAFKTGPDGFMSELICPDECTNRPWHQDEWANNGADTIVTVDEETVIGIVPVIPEIKQIKKSFPDENDDEELWFRPVVPEAE